MKSLHCILLISTALSACAFAKLTPIEYNNRVVVALNEISEDIESSVEIYDSQIPNTVTEESDIDVSGLRNILTEARSGATRLENLPELQSRSEEQETAVKNAVAEYGTAHASYLQTYEGAVNYYENKGYQEDVEQVEVVDTALRTAYSNLIDAHNHLVEVLDSYIE